MELAIIIHKDEGSVYGVTVPDIPGCFSSGDTISDAISNTKEAIYSHLEVLLESGESVSLNASSIDELAQDPDYQGGMWAFVSVDMSKLDVKPERINISVPRFVLSQIDEFISARHETRSGFLARAALNAIAEESKKAVVA